MPGENNGQDSKKQWGIGALCVVLIAGAAVAVVKEMPPPPVPIKKGNGFAPGYPGGGGGMGGGMGGMGGGMGRGGGQRPPGTGGKITTVSGKAITVQPRSGGPKTFALTAATKITVDRKPATAADLKAGLGGFVVSKDSKTADEVHLRTGAGRGGPGGPGGGGPGGGGGGYPGGGPGGPPGGFPGGAGPAPR